ncbi:kelch motif protein (macronuclear) [Tetrahymena thermophila SB210]|uniref:Kelch motif protein n=1 Tax=Tetrahymena thermophila (strain SB210) TaxID=312017 RepID=Q23RX9_TETTS|nr:kelch motif protein [Tetrahymena thermophila SB210]EAR99260.1 kelch motif protein [Tetrahymena thermophila SB210]|eukprot:XP_001019505.1 kelch motif protein [Tetrahymena thermophila SB210]
MYSNRVQQVSPPKLQNTQGSEQSFYMNNRVFFCQKHNEQITNFSVQELKPLCPECVSEIFANGIDDHSVDSLKNVKINCSKKIKTGVYELNRQLESSEIKYLLNPQGIIDEGVQEIQKCKKQIMRIVDFHFEQLFIQFKSQVQDNVLKASDLTYIFENIKQSIVELDQLSNNLEQGNTIQAIVKVCQLDLKSLIDKFKSDIHKIVDSRDLDPIKIIQNNNAVNDIKRILPQVAVINKIHSHYHNHSPPRQQSPPGAKSSQNRFFNTQTQFTQPPIQQFDNGFVPANPNFVNSNFTSAENLLKQQQLLSQQIQQQQPYQQQEKRPLSNTQVQNQAKQDARPPSMNNFASNPNRPPYALVNPNLPSLQIRNKDYFNQNTRNKLLVSIQNQVLQGVDLNLSSTGNLAGSFEIPLQEEVTDQNAVLVAQNGDIYVIGGVYRKKNQISNEVKRIVVSPDRKSCQIETVAYLYEPRYAHSAIQLQDRIYVIGGFSSKRLAKNEVETIYIKDNQFGVDISQECLHHSAYPSLSVLQDQYIVKVGGINEQNQLVATIERYDSIRGEWENIDPIFENNIESFSIFFGSESIAINNNEIMIFGGSDEQNQYSKLSYILSFKNREIQITDIMKYPFPLNVDLINVQPIIQDNLVYLKNPISKKTVLCFNGQSWQEVA